jgi:ketosteroid isomerase-like protein
MNETNHTQSDPKIAAVQRMYDALGRGDIDAILAEVAEDVDWVSVATDGSASVPWYGSYQGRADVPRFFKEIASNVQITEFSPLSFTSNETDVMVALVWTITVNATGKNVTLPMQHWFRFADGKVAAVRTSEDSEQTAAAFQ